MADGLLKVLVWMPTVKTFCGAMQLETGSIVMLGFYVILSFWTFAKPLMTIPYHHDSEYTTFIKYIQCVFSYIAFFAAFFAFYIGFNFIGSMKKFNLTFNPRSIFTHLLIILCLIMGCSEIIWSLLAFIRAFLDPGLYPSDLRSNKSDNPYPKDEVCRTVSTKRRTRKKCRPVTAEEARLREKWDRDHANDTIVYQKSETFDAVYAAISILAHLYGFYLVVTFRSYVLHLLEQEEETEPEPEPAEEPTE